jgi:hypothetical protein
MGGGEKRNISKGFIREVMPWEKMRFAK